MSGYLGLVTSEHRNRPRFMATVAAVTDPLCGLQELLETMRNKEKRGSLLWVLDQTKTAMGKRLLRTWIEQPLLSCGKIIRRQNAVEELYCDPFLCGNLADQLTGVFDLQRLITRIVYGTANGRELRSLSATIGLLPELKKMLENRKSELLQSIYEDLDTLEDVHDRRDA